MSIKEKITSAMNDFDTAFSELADETRKKIDENLTEEKKAEYKEDFKNLGNDLKKIGKEIGGEVSNIFKKQQ